jgi:CspA family cold shock protein
MPTGIVKFFHAGKGFGFILPEDGSKDVFVHVTDVEIAGMSGLSQGQNLSFETEINGRGAVKAIRLKPNLPIPLKRDNSEDCPEAANSNQPSTRRRNAQKHDRGIASELPAAQADGSGPKASRKSNEWQRSYDRFCDLARNSNDDLVARENYWQYAEHFLRMMNGSST